MAMHSGLQASWDGNNLSVFSGLVLMCIFPHIPSADLLLCSNMHANVRNSHVKQPEKQP